ncbi:MAG: hypothetical protein IKU19_06670 [Clostridia bacterium]|nr:hypothetical protein [Clostridia bacterium]
MKKRNSVLFISIYVILLCACLLLSSCGEKKQEMKTNKLSPDIYPAANVEYEYNSDGLPSTATVFKGEKVFCKYEYVYGEDGILEKRLEKNSKDILLCEYEYEDGKTLEYKSVYTEDGAVEKKFKYDTDGLVIQRTNYNEDGKVSLDLKYGADGSIALSTVYTYEDGILTKTEKSDMDGIRERAFYNREGIVTCKYEWTKWEYGDVKTEKHTEYDDDGNFEYVCVSTYNVTESEKLLSEKVYNEDGIAVSYSVYDGEYPLRSVVRYVEYDESGDAALLKCFNDHGLIHYVTYESGKTVSWTEYVYDENGKVTGKTEHNVSGIYVEPDGISAKIYAHDVTGTNTRHEYINLDEWEYPDNVSAKNYFYASDITFEEGDTVPVDELIYYFTTYEMMDKNKSYELYEHLEQYRTGDDAYGYRISIPKEIVNAEIEKHFAVKIDGSVSKFTDPENEDCYLLYPDAKGMMSVVMKNYTVNGNRSTATYALYADISKEIYQKAEICIENEDSEENFKIIYVREAE